MVPNNKNSLLRVTLQATLSGVWLLLPNKLILLPGHFRPLWISVCVSSEGVQLTWWLRVIYSIVCPSHKGQDELETNMSRGPVITVYGVSVSYRRCGCRQRWSCVYSTRTSSCTTRCVRLPWTTSPCRSWPSPAMSQHHLCSTRSNEDLPCVGASWLGSWGDILEVVGFLGCRWWGSHSNAQPCCYRNVLSCVPQHILVHFNSTQFNLTHSTAQLILQIFIGW